MSVSWCETFLSKEKPLSKFVRNVSLLHTYHISSNVYTITLHYDYITWVGTLLPSNDARKEFIQPSPEKVESFKGAFSSGTRKIAIGVTFFHYFLKTPFTDYEAVKQNVF